jgi:hypothetical protein
MNYRAVLGALLALGWAGSAQAQRTRGVELSASYCVLTVAAADGRETRYLSRPFLTRWGEMQNDSYWYAIDQRPDDRMLHAFAGEVMLRHRKSEFTGAGCMTRPNRFMTFAMRDMFAKSPGATLVEMAWPPSEAIDSQTIEPVAVVPLSADARSGELLEYVVQTWFWEADRDWPVVMAPALRAAMTPKRIEQSAEMKRHGHVTGLRLLRTDAAGRRVFRAQHEHGVLDWTIGDDGKQITSLSWVVAPKE